MVYDGTVISRDPALVDEFTTANGMKAYVVLDESAFSDSPRGWDNASSAVSYEYRNGYRCAVADQETHNDTHDLMIDAVERWGSDHDLIDRFLRIYADAVAIERYSSRGGYDMLFVITAAAAEGEVEDPAAYLKGEVETYGEWAEGSVYGVIVVDEATGEEESLFGVYDLPFNYIKEVAEELAGQLS